MKVAAIHKKRPVRAAVAILVAILLAGFLCLTMLLRHTPGEGKTQQIFEFEQGYSVKKIAAELEGKRIIGSARLFLLYARFHRFDGKVKAGIYRFNDGMPLAEIVRKLVAGEIDAKKFAVPEGYSIYQIAELLEGKGLFGKEAFLSQCFNRRLMKELGIPGPSVEGYLYPSTYNITPKLDEAGFIRLMVDQFQKVYTQRFSERERKTDMRRREIVTLASMVEKEAIIPAERPLISSVFLNRLKKGMRLQSDPTAVYGVRAFAGKVSKKDILRRSSYNTYVIAALPPGPVGNPGCSAIESVLNPAATNYLYFVAKRDGTHQFSSTLEQHNRAVRLYLRSSLDTAGTVRRVGARDTHVHQSTAG